MKSRNAVSTVSAASASRRPAIARIVREGVLIALLAACGFLGLALGTYHASDPGWSNTGANAVVQNAGGPTGAWLADVSFSLFGVLAYLFPLLLAYQALMLLRNKRSDLSDPITLALRTVGLLLIMLAGTGLAVQLWGGQSAELPFSSGGLLGLAAANTAAEQAATTRAREAITKLRAQTDAMTEPLALEPSAHTLPAPEDSGP